jgi:HSP20 family protein
MNRSDPFEEIERLFDQMSQLGTGGESRPVRVDVIDEGDAFAVVADLPGFETEDIEVQLRDDQRLAITAEREDRRDEERDDYVRRERRRRQVSRTVPLPEPVDETETDASYDNGVLTVRLGKRSGGDGTSISVN